ncbi:MAG: ABC transporter substrate-binding protein [Turicibacter sp.]|nr:ABC transporter substrate-binding protein [Turicibacter sp.]
MRKIKNLSMVVVLFFGVIGLFLAGCERQINGETEPTTELAADGQTETPELSGDEGSNGPRTLTVGLEGDAVSLDPHASNVGGTVQILVQMYEPLVRLDVDGNVVGVLAESWERVDDYAYLFHLRQDVQFHNGAHMSAEDVAFSIRRGATSPAVSAIMSVFDPDNIEVVDTYTVRIGTHEPFAPLLNSLTHPAGSILSLAAYEAGVDLDETPIGTGPFVMTNRVHGAQIEFEVFEDYHGQRPAFDYLVIRPIVEPSSRIIALETGEIDIANITRTDVTRVANNPALDLHQRANLQMLYIGINTERVSDVRVRQAINYAIDNNEIHQTLLYGVGQTLTGPISDMVPGARTDLTGYPFNPDRARELLAEAGYADGLELTLIVNEFPDRQEWALAAQSYLANVGITLHITQIETPIFLEETANGHYDLFVLAWTTATGDPDYGLHPLFHSDNRGGPGNRTFFSHPRVDELLDIGRSSFDTEVRLEAYSEAQEIIVDEAAMVYLATGSTLVGTQTNIRGLNLMPIGIQLFYTVYFE